MGEHPRQRKGEAVWCEGAGEEEGQCEMGPESHLWPGRTRRGGGGAGPAGAPHHWNAPGQGPWGLRGFLSPLSSLSHLRRTDCTHLGRRGCGRPELADWGLSSLALQ